MSDQAPPGIDLEKVGAFIDRPGLSAELISGGRSNLTYKLTDAEGRAVVLRRPPLGQVLATAHDMGREHRIISALGPTPVPVPPALAYCDDPEVNGAPFYVMGFVDGLVVRDAQQAEPLTPRQRNAAGSSLADVLAAIHAVDPDEVGLGDLGRRNDYIARQLKRWYSQFQQSKTREVPVVDEMHAFLSDHTPVQQGTAIVHGDYRLDNCILDRDRGNVVARHAREQQRLGDHRRQQFDMGPACDLGDDTAEPGVQVDLAGDHRRHHRVAIGHHRGGRLVAGRLDAQDQRAGPVERVGRGHHGFCSSTRVTPGISASISARRRA